MEAEVAGRLCNLSASRVADIRPGTTGSKPRELIHAQGALFFTAEDGVHGRELWISGGPQGAGPALVKDARPGTATSNPRRLTVAGNKLFFTAEDGVHGRELWVSDGTQAGTVMVKDIFPGPLGSAPDQLLAFGGVLYFAANDGTRGTELWRSDGTPEGTFLVEDLYAGEDLSSPGAPGSSSPRRLTQAGDAFYFVAQAGNSLRVWRSEGVPGATSLLATAEDSFLLSFTAAGPELFFLLDEQQGQASLWWGQGAQTQPLRSFPGFYPHELTPVGETLFFTAGGGEAGLPGDAAGEELWRSDGTAGGTVKVKDIRPGPESSAPGAFAAMNGLLYFAADDGSRGRELWVSNGTGKGTLLMSELRPGPGSSSPQGLTVIAGTLFFSAETEGRGREPWVSDGTAAGTLPLAEIAPGSASSNPTGFVRVSSKVFFTATEASGGEELWVLPVLPGSQCSELPVE
ncbi:ELWxxDGT repeat protein [Hyalangium rubrum]|uniref:ELWxxDGT repeat protein n=1 Tax=Hyalangium rubrum TaxID=3103134 RepID=A0ABU5GZ46_9BACT|nr:ELWxxDGT repeat protein [Hyalangium sp. s54d21]MDY7226459.1 ELWxxDGT repeat protein [Hyalangium sp. s54d21]